MNARTHMRGAVLLALLVPLGCGSNVRPAVMPNLTQVPDDKRGDVIDSSLVRPTPEQQPATKRGRKVETAAATAAAILGEMFSKTENTGMGFQFVEEAPDHASAHPQQDTGEKQAPPKPESGKNDDLVPWIKLHPTSPPP